MASNRPKPELLSGQESFTTAGQPTGLSVADFWRFQYSNIWDMQEEIAEFLVAKALGMELPYNKNGWTLWDIDYKDKRIEVKESGYYHSWAGDDVYSEQRTFGITKAYSKYKDSSSEFKRQNDVYVFCLNTGHKKAESNPLETDNWRFWVVPTEIINRVCGNNKTITLGRIKSITYNTDGIGYANLKAAIDRCCRGPHPFYKSIPSFKSGREFLDWIKEGSWVNKMDSGLYEEYLWSIKGAVESRGYDVPISKKVMCKALDRTLLTGEVIEIEPDPEFLPGGENEGQCDGWTYHPEFLDAESYFHQEVYASLGE